MTLAAALLILSAQLLIIASIALDAHIAAACASLLLGIYTFNATRPRRTP